MSFQSQLDARLWAAVQKSYEDGDHSGSILDSFYFLSELIRNKSGCESDGAALIGAAFGGQNPVVKINAFRTESELSEQRGVEQLLRGLYLALRNPRSHEKRIDSAETAEAVITFISFLIGMIDKSKSPFDTEQIIQKVFDKHFVPSPQYAEAIATKVPVGKRYDLLCQVFQRRTDGKIEHIALFVRALSATLGDESKSSFWEMVSGALEEAASDAEVRTAVFITGSEWDKLSEIARLRTEHRLIASISEGEYNSQTKSCPKGSLGTWASGITSHFGSKEALKEALIARVSSGGQAGVDYVLRYFQAELFDRKSKPSWALVHALKQRLDSNDKAIETALWFVGTTQCNKQWTDEMKGPLSNFKERNPDPDYIDVGISDDDIPF
jgi:uncharacterized protein (TIGR02391 family)